MRRRRFNERDVIETLLHQGVEIRSYRSGELVTLENFHTLEREHLHELGLGGADQPFNCRYSFKAEHKMVTNGSKATTAGSSKQRMAKTRGTRSDKFVPIKKPIDEPRENVRDWRSRTFQKRAK